MGTKKIILHERVGSFTEESINTARRRIGELGGSGEYLSRALLADLLAEQRIDDAGVASDDMSAQAVIRERFSLPGEIWRWETDLASFADHQAQPRFIIVPTNGSGQRYSIYLGKHLTDEWDQVQALLEGSFIAKAAKFFHDEGCPLIALTAAATWYALAVAGEHPLHHYRSIHDLMRAIASEHGFGVAEVAGVRGTSPVIKEFIAPRGVDLPSAASQVLLDCQLREGHHVGSRTVQGERFGFWAYRTDVDLVAVFALDSDFQSVVAA